jgi:hypothetical protein
MQDHAQSEAVLKTWFHDQLVGNEKGLHRRVLALLSHSQTRLRLPLKVPLWLVDS